MTQRSIEELIGAARNGDTDALGELLERYRDRFRMIARQELDAKIQGRVDPSDVIQQSFLEAREGFSDFRGDVEPQFAAWLKMILKNNVSNTIQSHVRADKRSVLRERSIEGSSSRHNGRDPFPGHGSSPSHRAIRNEDKEQILQVLERLPQGQRQAIHMRYIEEQSLIEIANEMGRSRLAVAGLLKRGLRQLRSQMTIDL